MPSTCCPSSRRNSRVRDGTATCTRGFPAAWQRMQASALVSTIWSRSSPVENVMRPALLNMRTLSMVRWRATLFIIS